MNTRNVIVSLFSILSCVASLQAGAGSTAWANPDMYGHVLFDPPRPTTDATVEAGEGDLYGSVLLDPRSRATTDAFVERGDGDLYGSILLDDVVAGKRAGANVASR
jgi:hypothetical protein